MRPKHSLLAVLLFVTVAWSTAAAGHELVFEGPWHTTNRKLDGNMTCVVSDLGEGKWQGRFYGIWQGVDFDYTVRFTGTLANLQGTAIIDGADYTWNGVIDSSGPGSTRLFRGVFGGNRYAGQFELKEKSRLK
jgi:hypothetical protein